MTKKKKHKIANEMEKHTHTQKAHIPGLQRMFPHLIPLFSVFTLAWSLWLVSSCFVKAVQVYSAFWIIQ